MENTGDTLVCHVQWWQMHLCNVSLTKHRSTRFCILQVSKDGKLHRSFQLKRLINKSLKYHEEIYVAQNFNFRMKMF